MAKFLIIRLQPKVSDNVNDLVCYYDSLNQELIKQGNEVLWLNNLQECCFHPKKQIKKKQKWLKSWINKIKEFNPDIIFTFNNQIHEEIIQLTNCPIVLFEADLINLFVKTDLIKKYKERYYMVTYSKQYINQYKALGFDDERIIVLHPATSVQRENIEKINNISFIGTAFPSPNFYLKNILLESGYKNVYDMFLDYWNNQNYNYNELVKDCIGPNDLKIGDVYTIFNFRTYILQSILDLGLKLYGVHWDDTIPPEILPLIAAFDPTPIYSLQHNQDVYNSSVINLSISHPQCEGYSFPWRIYDIMASGGVLVSSYAKQLEEQTKGFVNIPMFKSPFDARELCKKMLKENSYREDIISASNEFIEKNGRWTDNLKKIQDYTDVNMIQVSGGIGAFFHIEYELRPMTYNKTKERIKSAVNGISYFLLNCPIIYSLINKKGRTKIYNSIIKHNKEFREFCKEASRFW